MSNLAYLLLWPAAGLIALAITVMELRKVGATFTELIDYLHQLKSSRPLGKSGIALLCVIIVVLGPVSLVPIVMDAIGRAQMGKPSGHNDMGTGIAKTIFKVFAAATAISAALLAAAWLLSR